MNQVYQALDWIASWFLKVWPAVEPLVRPETRAAIGIMIIWAIIGLGLLARDAWAVWQDDNRLRTVMGIAKNSSKPEAKRRQEIEAWANANEDTSLASWLNILRTTASTGERVNASALTDSIFSQERERHFLFRFFARSAVLLGLLFTSFGLCSTLLEIEPAIRASGLPYDRWVAGVQSAMALALGGMATAFISSFLGIGETLGMTALATIVVTAQHERYLHRADQFVQGTLVPLFGQRVEADRQRPLIEAINGLRDVVVKMGQEHRTIIQRLDDTERARKEMDELKTNLQKAVGKLQNSIGKFGQQVDILENAANQFGQAGESVRKTIQHSADQLNQAHQTATRTMEFIHKTGIDSLTQSQTQAVASLTQTQQAFLQDQQAFQQRVVEPFTQQVANRYGQQEQAVQTMVAELNRLVNQVGSAQAALQQEIATLGQVGTTLSGAAKHFDGSVGKLANDVNSTIDRSLARQEQIVADLGQAAQQRVDKLVAVLDAVMRA